MIRRIRRFFFPPPESSVTRRYFPWALTLGGFIVALLIIPPAWEYSNTSEFCGTTCHTMPPEYNTYLVSPHARVPCVDCHIGRDWIAKQVLRKSVHLRLIYLQVTGSYEYPIRVSTLRPARETCELCHFPEKFSDDSLRASNQFASDESNSPYQLYLLMHTGGGSERQGLGRGIHWHVENKVEFIATDPEQQDIPWVRVTETDGSTTAYAALDASIDLTNVDQYDIQTMDCITCHNRIAHDLPQPRELIDAALYRGDLSSDIPYIRENAVKVFNAHPDDAAAAQQAILDLGTYYQQNYPDFYASNQQTVEDAVNLLLELYAQDTYPEQELNWETHPNNIGHRDSPGCFRCHDGKHFTEDGMAVRLECNLCHSIPQVVVPGVIEPTLPLTTGIEPTSHLDSTWIAQHHLVFDETCANCHTMENPGGVTNTSFCSNSGCHGIDWEFAGFNAPELAAQLGLNQAPAEESAPLVQELESGQVTYHELYPMFETLCGRCHGDTPAKGLKLTEYSTLMQGAEDGPVVVPGSPDESKIIQVLTAGHFAQVTDEQLGYIREWIAAGAPEGEPIGGEAAQPAPAAETPVGGEEGAQQAAPTTAPAEGGFQSYWETQIEGESGGAAAPAEPAQPTEVPPTEAPATEVPPTEVQPTEAPATQAPAAPAEAPTATEEFHSYWETH